MFSVDELREAKGVVRIDFSLGGEVFSIAPPWLWDESIMAMHSSLEDGSNIREFMVALLGDQYDRFKAAGGVLGDLTLVLEAFSASQGVGSGE